MLLEVTVVLGLMLLNGTLAMSELAMMSSRRGRLEQLAIEDRGARAALRLLDDPTGFLSTVQVGITLVGILAGAFSGATLGGYLAQALVAAGIPVATANTIALVGVVLVITYLSLIVGELVPKRLALTNRPVPNSRVTSRHSVPREAGLDELTGQLPITVKNAVASVASMGRCGWVAVGRNCPEQLFRAV